MKLEAKKLEVRKLEVRSDEARKLEVRSDEVRKLEVRSPSRASIRSSVNITGTKCTRHRSFKLKRRIIWGGFSYLCD